MMNTVGQDMDILIASLHEYVISLPPVVRMAMAPMLDEAIRNVLRHIELASKPTD